MRHLHLTSVEFNQAREMYRAVCSCQWDGFLWRTRHEHAVASGKLHKDMCDGSVLPFQGFAK